MLLRCCTQYASKFGKLSNGHSTGKDQFSFQCQRKAMPKNVQTTEQLHSFHMLARLRSKIFWARLQQYVNQELSDVQFGFRKDRETRDQITNICWIIQKARGFQRNIYFCYTDYTKAFGHEFNHTPGDSEGQGSLSYSSPWGCSKSSSSCCFLTCIQVSQETGKVVWYPYLFKNFPVCCDPHSQRF